MIGIAAQKLKHLTIELGWGFPVGSVPDLVQCDYLVLRQVFGEHALKRGGAYMAPAQPCINTISNTTSFSPESIPGSGSRTGMTMVSGFADDCSQRSAS